MTSISSVSSPLVVQHALTPEDIEGATAVHAAISGNPDLLVRYITMRLREDSSDTEEAGISANSARAQVQSREREKALEESREAAAEAEKWGLIGKIVGIVSKVVSAVVSAVSSAFTCAIGTIVGTLLQTFAGEIAQGLVDAGIIPESAKAHVAVALSIAGGVISGGGMIGAACDALFAYLPMAMDALQSAGLDSDIAMGLKIGISVVGAAVSGTGAAGMADAAIGIGTQATTEAVSSAVTNGARAAVAASAGALGASTAVAVFDETAKAAEEAAKITTQAARITAQVASATVAVGTVATSTTDAGQAVELHQASGHRADATRAKARGEEATAAVEVNVDTLRVIHKRSARLTQMADEMTQVRHQTLTAALSLRA